jgi:hypothetical protein
MLDQIRPHGLVSRQGARPPDLDQWSLRDTCQGLRRTSYWPRSRRRARPTVAIPAGSVEPHYSVGDKHTFCCAIHSRVISASTPNLRRRIIDNLEDDAGSPRHTGKTSSNDAGQIMISLTFRRFAGERSARPCLLPSSAYIRFGGGTRR